MKKTLKIIGIIAGVIFLFLFILANVLPDPPKEVIAGKKNNPKKDSTSISNNKTPLILAILPGTDVFKNNFNNYSAKQDFEYSISDLNIEDGEVRNTFRYSFSEEVGIIGAVNKEDNSLRSVTAIIGTSENDRKAQAVIDGLSIMACIVNAVDPNTSPEALKRLFTELHIFGKKKLLPEQSVIRNNIEYTIQNSDYGLWFIASVIEK